MLLREFTGGSPPYACKLILVDDPAGFGRRVVDGGRLVEHVLTRVEDFESAAAERGAEGLAETERSLTRRVLVSDDQFWIVWLDGDAVVTHVGGRRVPWAESVGQTRARQYRGRDRAVAAYHAAVADKLAGGYRESYARAVRVPDAPKGPRRSGRKKSR